MFTENLTHSCTGRQPNPFEGDSRCERPALGGQANGNNQTFHEEGIL